MIDMAAIHKAFCKRNKIKYAAKNLVKDLSWNCFAVATVLADLLKTEGKEARAVYGLWHGECVGKPGHPFHRHGWTIVGKEVWDATRFVFEGKKPYLFKGKLAKHVEYDEGMRRARALNRSPFPVPGQGKVYNIMWSYPTYMFISGLINDSGARIVDVDPVSMNYHQLMWLGNTDYLTLGEHITEIYTKLLENDLGVVIPQDYLSWWKANKK